MKENLSETFLIKNAFQILLLVEKNDLPDNIIHLTSYLILKCFLKIYLIGIGHI